MLGSATVLEVRERGLGVLALHPEHRDVVVAPVDVAHMAERRRRHDDLVVGRLDREAAGLDRREVVAARDERDVVTVLRQAATDDAANPTCTDDDEPHDRQRRADVSAPSGAA